MSTVSCVGMSRGRDDDNLSVDKHFHSFRFMIKTELKNTIDYRCQKDISIIIRINNI